MHSVTKPSVLMVYSYTQFTDARHQKRFKQFPMPRPFLEVVAMVPAELGHGRAQIGLPDDVVTERTYDFVVIGAPTWWLSGDVPIRVLLESDTAVKVPEGKPFTGVVCCRRYWKHNLKTVRRIGTRRDGSYVDGIGFRYLGGQVRSLFSLLGHPGSGEYKERYHGVKIPPTNLQDHHLDRARTFAGDVGTRLTASSGGLIEHGG